MNKQTKRKHCSLLQEVKPVKTGLSLIRHFLMQEDDSSTIEEGFSIVKSEFILATNNRGTKLTATEYEKDGWFVTEENVVDRLTEELGECAQVDAVLFLLRKYEELVEELRTKEH